MLWNQGVNLAAWVVVVGALYGLVTRFLIVPPVKKEIRALEEKVNRKINRLDRKIDRLNREVNRERPGSTEG